VEKEKFMSLPFYEQLRTLYFDGAFVTAIRYYKHKVNLYLLHDYYVEVFFNHKLAKIDQVAIYDGHPGRTKFYADQVKLPSDLFGD
jgi:hypothetical protein